MDSAAPVENVDRPAGQRPATRAAASGGPAHVPHRRLENSLREFPTLPTGSTTADDFYGSAAEQPFDRLIRLIDHAHQCRAASRSR